MQTTVIYPGTFDPITNGHLDIIERSALLFPKIIVAVAASPSKKPLFDLAQRIELVRQSTQHLNNVEVIGFSGLLADVIKQHNIKAIIRGVRAVADFEYELQMAQTNHKLASDVETIFLTTNLQYSYLSSTTVKEVAAFGGDISQFVPDYIEQKVWGKMKHKRRV